jgi:hypothetical protein
MYIKYTYTINKRTCVVFVNLVFILEEVAWIKYIFDLKFYNISDYQLNYKYQALIHWENTCPSYFTYITLKHFLEFFHFGNNLHDLITTHLMLDLGISIMIYM